MGREVQATGTAVALRRRPRRRRSLAEKLAIIRECLEPGASLAGVALAHGANANMVRKWVVKYQQGGYGRLPAATPAMLPVQVKRSPAAARSRGNATALPVIEIELRHGIVRLHGADARLLQALIDTLSA